jgi:hypothetical protein
MHPCSQAKLLNQTRTHQIIIVSPVSDETCTSILNDEENLKQIMLLQESNQFDSPAMLAL